MACKAAADGAHTARYRVVQGHFYPLVLNFEQLLVQLAAKFFEQHLIGKHDLERASNPRQPAFERSSALLRRILRKIEQDQRMYDVFVSVLDAIPKLKDIASELELALKKEEDCSHASPAMVRHHLPRRASRRPQPKVIGRRHSDSDIISSKVDDTSEDSVELDSGLAGDLQASAYAAGDTLQDVIEVDDSSVFENEPPRLLCAHEPGEPTSQPIPARSYTANDSTSSADSAPLASSNAESDDEAMQPHEENAE